MAPHRHIVPSDRTASSQNRLLLSLVLNLFITVVEVVGGLVSNSLALLSDALHNFNDAASLGISWCALKLSRKPPDEKMSYGYRRAQIIGAFANLVTLVIVALFLLKEAVQRFLQPEPIQGPMMFAVALVGLVANLVTAGLLYRDSRHSLNVKSAFVHIVSDTISSIAVLAGGYLIVRYEVHWVDPAITFMMAGYILAQSFGMLKETTHILMEGTPHHLDAQDVVRELCRLEHVRDVHHVHIWQIDEARVCFDAHVLVDIPDLAQLETVKEAVKARLANGFGINHSTLEFESAPCRAASRAR